MAALLVSWASAYAVKMYHKYGAVVPDQKVFDERKENYLHRRNNFLKDKKASEDLKNWKAKNNEFNYSEQ